MNSFKSYVAGASLLAVVATFMSSRPATAQSGRGNPEPGSAPVNIVSPLPLPVTGSLEVTGSVSAPLPVTSPIDARIPVQATKDNTGCAFNGCQVVLYTVPDRKRLVVEYISGSGHLLPGGSGGAAAITLSPEFGGQVHFIDVGVTRSTGSGDNARDVFADVVKVYAEPGDVLCAINAASTTQKLGPFTCSITGYLEDLK